ncbi:uncharacterized protein A1O5_11653 [Cladophialophora psammophila CBS 110553]|uniref:Nephrocystin 3-like N-terminal domain-containing protein n=1 Tax=Cladophialophora psammophila CBS 110553 TaxID=1182543 RepID=W9W5J9_9EURO|nr:uncharacterized protein A1O5_11653 [Cladophialophora psammophila CBS 110553]EXJ63332.1 hypothetical protein A1O5_11653 [Cladophialophora psammophila CBS 110553]
MANMTFAMPSIPTLNQDFDDARDEFLDQLADEDRNAFRGVDTREQLHNYTAQLAEASQFKKRPAVKILRIVVLLTEALAPCFEALELVTQGVSACASMVWGSISLILKMASPFPAFFAKLGDLLQEVSAHIPPYRKLLELTKSDASPCERPPWNDALSLSLHGLCADLFDLFGNLGKVFTQKDARLKKASLVVPNLLWHPFEARFENFLKKLAVHTEILDSEMLVLAQKPMQAVRPIHEMLLIHSQLSLERMPEHNDILREVNQGMGVAPKSELIDRIWRWLCPPSFADALRGVCSLRQEGTANWLFKLPEYNSWLTTSQGMDGPYEWPAPWLWVRGVPGTGKTVLACATISKLSELAYQKANGSKVISYFFFDHDNPARNSIRSAYASLLAQVLDQCSTSPDILDLFSYAMTRRTRGQDLATKDDMADILKLLTPLLQDWYIVIDAVDECAASESFLRNLLDLRSAGRPRILLFSRPNVSYLHRNVPAADTITVTPELVNADLRCFLSVHLEEMQNLDLFPRGADRDELICFLLTGADGVFKWAQLMIIYLKSDVLDISSRMRLIRDLKRPEKLENMYMRILEVIARKPRVEQIFARRLFVWLVFGKGVGRLDQLQDLLQTLKGKVASDLTLEEQRSYASKFANFEDSIVAICSSLVELRWSEQEPRRRVCRFDHYSAHEFLRLRCSQTCVDADIGVAGTKYLHPPRFEAESELLMACFQYRQMQQFHRPSSRSSFQAVSYTILDNTRPFLRYATLLWVAHLKQPSNATGKTLDALIQTLRTFLADGAGMLAWVEALYIYQADTKRIFDDLGRWASKLPTGPTSSSGPFSQKLNEIAHLVHALVRDLHQLDKAGKAKLLRNPGQLWTEITAFSNSPFFARPSATTAPQAAPEGNRLSRGSSAPFAQISREKADEDIFAILKIWPSAVFDSATKNGYSPNAGESSGMYQGWIAQYQLWSIRPANPVLNEEWDFPLGVQEISSYVAIAQSGSTTNCLGFFNSASAEADTVPINRQFPISIGQNLDMFTVLHKVYASHRNHLFSPETCRTNPCNWYCKRLPIIYDARSVSVFQPLDRCVQDSRSSGVASRESRTVFKAGRPAASRIFVHNDLVIYQGVASSNYDRGLDHYSGGFVNESSFMAIFKVEAYGRGCSVKVIAVLDGLDFANVFNSCTFHPTLPLVGLIWHTGIFYHCAALWSFATPSRERKFGASYVTPKDFQIDTIYTSTVLVDCGPVARVQFSGRGSELLVEFLFHYLPGVFELEESAAYHAAVAARERSMKHRIEQISGFSRRGCGLDGTQTRFPGPLGARQQQDGLVVHRDGAISLHVSKLDLARRSVVKPTRNVDSRKEQTASSRAVSSDVDHLRVSVRSPTRTRQDKIALILKQAKRPDHEFSGLIRDPRPTASTGDVRAMAPCRWMHIGSLHHQVQDETQALQVSSSTTVDASSFSSSSSSSSSPSSSSSSSSSSPSSPPSSLLQDLNQQQHATNSLFSHQKRLRSALGHEPPEEAGPSKKPRF